MITAVIFDLDGTLVDTEEVKAAAYIKVIEPLRDEPVDRDSFMRLYRRQVGQPDATTARSLTAELGLEEALASLDPDYGGEPWQLLDSLRSQEYRKAVTTRGALDAYRRDEVIDLMRDLKSRGYPTAVATSSLTEDALLVLEALGVQELADQVVGVDQVTHPKPDPEIYRLAASRLGAGPEDCMAVEDSTLGVRSATDAGMWVVAAPNAFTRQDFAGYAPSPRLWIVDDLTRLHGVAEEVLGAAARPAPGT